MAARSSKVRMLRLLFFRVAAWLPSGTQTTGSYVPNHPISSVRDCGLAVVIGCLDT
jgi:hypothetical protein